MEFMTTKEAVEKWNISERRIRQLLADGRIEGAVKVGNSWNIPIDADKPVDKRIIKPDDNKFIIIGTDGLWDNIGNEEAVKLVGEYYEMKEKAENAARALVEKARQTRIERNEKLGNNKKKDNGSNTLEILVIN